ncbi:hypothetical protein QBC35DRAFT_515160 [Podospora australis]|uniref:2'-phosphotransferase n=1 Tax=Podospora australis TaxID=1536484 RepID=A0AAN7AHZ6_9PEZI|nr:hypothetical protein QBC35DRAFT_515160 [Podospora australis]
MAAAVAVPLYAITNELGGVLPPSALSNNSPRHGRSRGMSFKSGPRASGRRYSVVEERDSSIAKALMFVIKRAVQHEEAQEEAETPTGEYLVADAEGWIPVSDLLTHSRIAEFNTDLADVQRVVSSAIKARFELRQTPNTNANDSASWQILRITTKSEEIAASNPVSVGAKLTADDADLPEFVVYETSYQRYPLLLTLGAITRAPGGAEYHSFVPVDESRQQVGEAAEVSVWIHLKSALQADSKITWRRSDTGLIITSDEVPKSLWKKAVARRPGIGLLFEDGEVKKDVPAGLRGKAAKGKGKKGDRASFKRDGSGDDSASGSEEQEE